MLIRKLHPEEYALYADHLKRLAPEDRQSRFSECVVSDHVIETYVAGISPDDLLMGAFDDDNILVAAVHVALANSIAEIGVSVEAKLRGNGVGTELMDHAAMWARNRHAEKMISVYSDSNRSMGALAHHLGMSITHDHGVAEGVVDLPPPDAVTVADEIASDVHELWHDWTHLMTHCQDLWFGRFSVKDATPGNDLEPEGSQRQSA